MFKNIGGKIKGLAIAQTIIFVILGIVIWSLPYQVKGLVKESDYVYFVIAGIVVMIVGWIAQWILYAFGHLVQNTEEINNNLEKMLIAQIHYYKSQEKMHSLLLTHNAPHEKSKKMPKLEKTEQNATWGCAFCGGVNPSRMTECKICKRAKLESEAYSAKIENIKESH